MVADTRDVFKLWDISLRKLYAIRQGLMSGSGDVGLRQAVWERQYWKGADKAGDQILDFEDVERLCKRLNVNLTTAELEKLFKVVHATVFIIPVDHINRKRTRRIADTWTSPSSNTS